MKEYYNEADMPVANQTPPTLRAAIEDKPSLRECARRLAIAVETAGRSYAPPFVEVARDDWADIAEAATSLTAALAKPDAGVSPEDHMDIYACLRDSLATLTRLRDGLAALDTDALVRAVEYLDNYADTQDGPDSQPVPNAAMSLMAQLDDLRDRLAALREGK